MSLGQTDRASQLKVCYVNCLKTTFLSAMVLKFLLIYCGQQTRGQEDDFRVVASQLSKKRGEFEGLLVVARVREQMPQINRDVSRYTLLWSFSSRDNLSNNFMHNSISEGDWSSNVKNEMSKVASLESLEGSMKSWDEIFLRNAEYAAAIDRKSDIGGWSIDRIHFGSESWRIPSCAFSLFGMVNMLPYDIPIDEFLAFKGVTLRECVASKKDSDVVTVVCDAEISAKDSPFGESFRGTWSMDFRKSRGVIESQKFSNELTDGELLVQYFFDEGSRFPKKFLYDDFEISSGVKKSILTYDVQYVDISKHHLPSGANYLSFFRLPEPPGVELPRSGGWLGVFVVAAIVLGCVLVTWKVAASRRKRN
jgi:hypothetical protein